jgi:hypothetical protein
VASSLKVCGPGLRETCARCKDRRRGACVQARAGWSKCPYVKDPPVSGVTVGVLRQAGAFSPRERTKRAEGIKENRQSGCVRVYAIWCVSAQLHQKTAELPFHLSSAGLLAVFGGLVVLCRHYVWSRVAGTVCGQGDQLRGSCGRGGHRGGDAQHHHKRPVGTCSASTSP